MQQKPNNLYNWKCAVDELEYREDGVDPVNTSSWRIIRHKLDGESNKISMHWYWIAAAVAVVMIFLWATEDFTKVKPGIPDNNTQPVVSSPVHFSPVAHETTLNNHAEKPLTLNQHPAKKNIIILKTTLLNKHIVYLKDTGLLQAPVLVQFSQHYTQPAIPDSVNIVKSAAKPRLGISHINDYIQTIESTPGVTMKNQPLRHYLRNTNEIIVNAGAVEPVKQHTLNKSSIIQN